MKWLTPERRRGWSILVLRVVVGLGFMAHGLAKWNRGPAGFAKLLHQLGAPLPTAMAWFVTALEIVGGLGLIIGLWVAAISAPLIVSLAVAIWTVHARNGFSSVNTIGLTPAGPVFGPPGYEINLLYIAALLVLAVAGPGDLSVDGWMRRRNGRRARG